MKTPKRMTKSKMGTGEKKVTAPEINKHLNKWACKMKKSVHGKCVYQIQDFWVSEHCSRRKMLKNSGI